MTSLDKKKKHGCLADKHLSWEKGNIPFLFFLFLSVWVLCQMHEPVVIVNI